MKVGIGLSTAREASRAAREAAREALRLLGERKAEVGLCFATADYCPQAEALLETLQDALGTDQVVGASGAGVLTSTMEVEEAPGLVVVAFASEDVGIWPLALAEPEELGPWLETKLGPSPGRLFICLADTYAVAPAELLQVVEEASPGATLVGGGSCDYGSGHDSFQFGPQGLIRGGVAGLVMDGVETWVGVAQACRPIAEPYLITRAQGSIVEELSGRPALEVLAEVFRSRALERGLFAGLSVVDGQTFGPGDYVVRPITALDPEEKRFTVAAEVSEGQSLAFALRDPRGARQELERLLSDCSTKIRQGPRPSFGLYFTCCGRGRSLYGQTGVESGLLRAHLGPVPLGGLFTGLEIAPMAGRCRLHLFSSVLVLVRPLGLG
jgi:small ligand-binding sensory domain FIST